MKITNIALIAALGTGMMCYAQSTSSSDQSSNSGQSPSATGKVATKGGADAKFAMDAAQGGLAEVQLGQLAQQNAQSQDVKDFGKKMVDDHTKANDQLKDVAQKAGMTLPTDINAKDKADMARLQKLQGAEFDKAYMKHMVMDHTKDVNEFKKEANSGKNADLKSFAQQTEPILEQHLTMAKDVNSKVSNGGSASKAKKSAGTPSGQ